MIENAQTNRCLGLTFYLTNPLLKSLRKCFENIMEQELCKYYTPEQAYQ